MKKTSSLLILLMAAAAHAEPTPPGGTPTYTTSAGNSFTYYYKDGTPVPPNVRVFVSPAGTAQLITPNGTGDSVFPTTADAQAARNYQPDCSGAVFGPGPAPAACSGGASGAGASTAVDDALYDRTSFELSTILYSAAEVGRPSCMPAGKKLPGSLDSWGDGLRAYMTGEAARDKTLSERVAAVQKKIEELTGANKQSKDMQVESIDLQIELVTASIESMNGGNGRIPLREKLLLATLKSKDLNGKENIKTVEAYKKMVDVQFVASVKAATAACERKKKVKECTTDEEGVETCVEKEVKDPVPGCDVALAQIPVIRTGPAQQYGETYLIAPLASTKMNDKMQKFEDDMTNQMAAIPRSSDADYDWSTPMEDGLKDMKEARKESGAKCADGSDAAGKAKIDSGAKNFLTSLGLSQDSNNVSKTFGDVWTAADNVVGQAAHRGEYFDYVGAKINILLGMDRTKLQTLLTTKSKLETYKANIKNSLAAGGTVAPNKVTTTNQTGGAPKAIGNSNSHTETQGTGVAAIRNNTNTVTGNIDSNKAATTTVPLSAAGASATFSGGIGTSLSSNKITSGTIKSAEGLSLGSSAMAQAKKSLDNIAKNDKKIADYITTTSSEPAKKGSAGLKEKAKAPTMFTIVNDPGADSVKGSMESSFNKLNTTAGSDELYKSASFGGNYSSGGYGGRYSGSGSSYGGSGRSSTTTTSMGYTKPTAGAASYKPASVSGGSLKRQNASDANVSEDSKLISQSIVAKRFKKKDEYDTTDNDSLFQRVTKAYIRNYEKVEEPAAVVEP